MTTRHEPPRALPETAPLLPVTPGPPGPPPPSSTLAAVDIEDASAAPRGRRGWVSPKAACRIAVVLLVFAFGILILHFGIAPAASTALRGSLASPPGLGDEDYRAFEDFLAGSDDAASAWSGGLLLSSVRREAAVGKTGATTAAATANEDEPEGGLLYFNQSSAYARLYSLEAADFFRYQNGWEAQITQALCSVATTAALLNSLRDVPGFKLPVDPVYSPFEWATQRHLLDSAAADACVLEALGGGPANADAVYHMGLGLAMVRGLASCFLEPNGYEAAAYPADGPGDEGAAKAAVIAALGDPASRAAINYDRGGIGQGPRGHGHWSPLGGYHEATDSFLVMDVAKYRHPMVWVPWGDLWRGAATTDNCGTTLSLREVDWSHGFSGAGPALRAYLRSRCVPGRRGFVVARPADKEL